MGDDLVNNDIDFNSVDDMSICLFLANKDITIKQKAFFIKNFRERIGTMKGREQFLLLINIDREFCECFSDYIKETVLSLSEYDVERTLYLNKYSRSLSELAKWIITQSWFAREKNGKHKNFFIAYELEMLLNGSKISKAELEKLGREIIEGLFDDRHNPELYDIILKHYIILLERDYPEFISVFKSRGYEMINLRMGKDLDVISQNLIIFFCHMIRILSGVKGIDFFEFYEDPKSKIVAFHDMNKIKLNISRVKAPFETSHNKMVILQYIFFVIGHELNHEHDLEYRRKPKEERTNPIEELKGFNIGHAEALIASKSRLFNLEFHDKYFNEYCSDIIGLKVVQEQQALLSGITDESKRVINKLLATKLLRAYSWKSGDKIVYISPAEFTRFTFLDAKDNIPKYAKSYLLDGREEVTSDVRKIEQGLTDYERITMGYYTPYIGVLSLVADGTVTTTDLLGDIPVLYERYHGQIDGKFPSYYETDEFNNEKRQ